MRIYKACNIKFAINIHNVVRKHVHCEYIDCGNINRIHMWIVKRTFLNVLEIQRYGDEKPPKNVEGVSLLCIFIFLRSYRDLKNVFIFMGFASPFFSERDTYKLYVS